MVFKILSNPNHLMIPGFCDSMHKQVTSAQNCTQALYYFAKQTFNHLWGMTETGTGFPAAGVMVDVKIMLFLSCCHTEIKNVSVKKKSKNSSWDFNTRSQLT